MPDANRDMEPRFFFSCGGLGGSAVDVVKFSGSDAISAPYRFDITLTSEDPDIDAESVINTPATLLIERMDEMYPYSGIITSFKYIETTVDHSTYLVVLQPSLKLLGLTVQSRIFQKMTVPDIIEKVIKDSGVTISVSLDVGNYPEREYVVQYEESDLSFISRLMEESGIWYFFKEDPLSASGARSATTNEELLITDKPANFSDVATISTLKYRSISGMVNQMDNENTESIRKFQSDRRIIPSEASGKTYNYRTPEVDLSHTKPISSGDRGSVYHYGGNFKDTGGAQKTVEVLAKRLLMQKIVLDGTGDCSGFRAGSRFTLEEHNRDSMNAPYLITRTFHSGSNPVVQEGGGGKKCVYINEFSCIPSDQADSFAPECATPVPRIPGIMTALIETEGSEYAALDDKGRYKVRLPFDRSDAENSNASKYMRLAQPYSGSDYGIHFPSHEGTEMIIGYVDGNPDKPLGLGTVPNANTLSPVKTATKQKGIIRTAGGNELIFDDTDQKQKITLKTNADNRAAFDDENKLIELQTTDGNGLLLDDQNKTVVLNADAHSITMSYGDSKGIEIVTSDGHRIAMSDTGKNITIVTVAGNTIEMSDNGKSITISDSAGKNSVTLDGNKGLTLESSGEINIKASKNLTIQGENVQVKSTKKMVLDAADEMSLKSGQAKEVLKKGGDVQINGQKINIKASGNLVLKGAKVAEN